MEAQTNQWNSVAEIMTVRDLAEYLRVSEAKVYRMAQDGHIPAFRVGRAWRFKKEQIDEWIERNSEV
jgi:excisionase family DNA binding protein